MLGKLLKYEWKATGKMMLPIYLIILVLSPIVCLIARIDVLRDTLGGIISSIILASWGFALFAMMVVTLVTILYRFHKNLLTDEGYLMHTLPVTVDHHIVAKGIAAFFWTIISSILFFLSALGTPILSGEVRMLDDLKELWSMLSQWIPEYLNISFASFLLLMLLLIFSAMLFTILFCYVSLALGQLFQKHRIAGAIGFGIGIWIVMEIIFSFLLVSFAEKVNPNLPSIFTGIHTYLLENSLLLLAASVIFYFVTRFILKRRLNLE